MDASRPWICYWILHSLALLDLPSPPTPSRQSIVDFLAACQHPTGGFGGGPFQLPHLATTYAAVSALVTLGPDTLHVINRETLFQFLLNMCVPADKGGGMTMHQGGEVDIRGCYCALATCHMLGLNKSQLADACSLDAFVAACQSMEGGIGGEPGNEAHGGYAFCGFAALMLAERPHAVDIQRLSAWAARMQGWMEGGFMGRTCKLVDGCYSLWQGGIFPLLAQALSDKNKSNIDKNIIDIGSGGGVSSSPKDTKDDQVMMDSIDSLKATVDDFLTKIDLNQELAAIKALPAASQSVAAASAAAAAQERVDVAVENSLKYEEQYQIEASQHSSHAEVRKADALMALEEASDAQEALEKYKEHAESAICSAVELLAPYRNENYPAASGNLSSNTGTYGNLCKEDELLYDPLALQLWLLACCQNSTKGGLRDKPGKHVDYYHTCYCLSGLSSAQHCSGQVLGGEQNLLAAADPLCNVVAEKVKAARAHFLDSV
jgi:protein farnesyltransferase subunit beta